MLKAIIVIGLLFFLSGGRLLAAELIIAHRGVHQNFSRDNIGPKTCTAERIAKPTHRLLENTIPSMAKAFELGADLVEIDLQVSSDGRVVVFHDWTLECRTNGKGVTEEQTFAYLRSLDIGYGYTHDKHKSHPFRCQPNSSDYKKCVLDNHMPTLKEILTKFPDKKFVINMKSGRLRVLKIIMSELKRINKEYNYDLSQLMFFCSKQGILDQARKEIPTMTVPKLGWPGIKSCLKDYFATSRFDDSCKQAFFAMPYSKFRALGYQKGRQLIEAVQKIKGKFGVISVNTKDAYKYVHQLGVDGIWTDRIEIIGNYF
jgi:glycerophosphoryl diester phosphodiesterase